MKKRRRRDEPRVNRKSHRVDLPSSLTSLDRCLLGRKDLRGVGRGDGELLHVLDELDVSGIDLDLDGSEDLDGSGFPSEKVGRELGLDGLEEEGDVDTFEREREARSGCSVRGRDGTWGEGQATHVRIRFLPRWRTFS